MNNYKFKIGDKVKVKRRATTGEQVAYNCSWIDIDMDYYIGKVGKIDRLSGRGNCRITFDGNTAICDFYFQPPVLQLIDTQLMFPFMYE